MATARITQAVPANVDPIKATLAFGDRAIPRLVRHQPLFAPRRTRTYPQIMLWARRRDSRVL